MFEQDEEKILKELFRENFSRELSRPEIQEAKQKLLSEFLAPEPAPLFSFVSPAFLAPAAALIAVFLVFVNIQKVQVPAAGPGAPIYQMFAPIMEETKAKRAAELAKAKTKQAEAQAEDPVHNHMKPRVVVKRVASRKGPTMVYQRSYRDVPVTIVWVFTGGGNRQ